MYKVVVRSVRTGGLCRTYYGFETVEDAQRFIQSLQKPSGDFWYEILKVESEPQTLVKPQLKN